MNRTTLIQHLIDYRTRWPDESPTVSRFIEFLSSRPDAFERSLPTGHVTGSAWLVDASGLHVPLTLHKKFISH